MADPITLTAAGIATLAFSKFIESSTAELGKQFSPAALAKLNRLREIVVERLQGKSQKLDAALVKIESGDRAALEPIANRLGVEMYDDETFAEALRVLAQEIEEGRIQQTGLLDVTAKRVEAEIEQEAQGNQVEQIGAKQIKADEDAVFTIKQRVN